MRVLVLLGLAVVAFAARSRWENPEPLTIQEKAFQAGKEYRFHFDGQIASGLPVAQSQQALTRLQAQLSVLFMTPSSALMQIERIRVGSAQKEIGEPKNIQPFEIVDEIELNPEHVRVMRMPLRFRYEDGLVSDIEFDQEDQSWSKNIKRAVLNMLQVNMSKQGASKQSHESSDQSDGEFFTAPELTIEGNCEMDYTIVKKSEEEQRKYKEKNAFHVSKSINFEKCTERVGERYNYRFGAECPSCDAKWTGEERNVQSSSIIYYNVVGTPEQFIIKGSESRSYYIYAPLDQDNTFFKTVVSSKLTLLMVHNRSSKISEPNPEKKETLLYSNEWDEQKENFHMTGDEEFTRNNIYPPIKNKPEIVSKLIKQAIKEMEETDAGVELAAPHYVARLVKILRLVNKEEMQKIHREVCESKQYDEETNGKMKEILNDALVLAGTKVTVEHLIEKISTKQISQSRATVLIQGLSNMRTPSQKHIDSLLSLCKESKRQPALRQSCYLTAGALMRGVCGEHRDKLAVEKKEKKCNRQLKQQYVDEIMQLFDQAPSRYEKILALKTLANAGLDLSVFSLEKVINDKKEEKTVRMEAIDSLRQLRNVMPRKIQSLLMPIFKNNRDHPEIRIASFNQVMQTAPERAILDQIAQNLEKESSHQVQSFVHSALLSYAKSKIPCEKRVADDIQASLKLVRVQPRKILDSTFAKHPLYSEKHMIGASLNWATLFSNDSVLPKEIMASIETAFAGHWQKYLAQVGASQENMDQVVFRILKDIEEIGLEKIFVRGKRSSSIFQPTQLLQQLFQKLAIKGRKTTQSSEEPHAQFYIRFRDLDYAFIPIDEQTLPEIINRIFQNGRIELGEIEQILTKGFRLATTYSTFVYERSKKFVTSLGLPVVINTKMPTVASLKGLVRVELLPHNGQNVEGIRVEIQAKPSIASTHVTKMTVWSPIVNQGIKLLHSIQTNIPLDLTLEANSGNRKMELKANIRAPKTSVRQIQLQSRPVTFITVWPKESRSYIETVEKTVYIQQFERQLRNLETEYTCPVTGLRVKTDGYVHGDLFNLPQQQPSSVLTGVNSFELRITPTKKTPEQYTVSAKLTPVESARLEQPHYFESFYEKDAEHFEVEKDSSEPEWDRLNSFKDYIKDYRNGNPIGYKWSLDARDIGGEREKKANAEVITVCDEMLRHCKVEIESKRSPLGNERDDWTMKASVSSLYPEQPSTFAEIADQKHREYHGIVEVLWGSEKKNSVEMKIQGEQNKQQRQWLSRLQQQERAGNLPEQSPLEKYSELVEAAMLNQYKAVVSYNIESHTSKVGLQKLLSLVKTYYLMNTWIEPNGRDRSGRLLMKLSVEPETRQFANLTLETPEERIQLIEVRLPYPLRLMNIRRQNTAPVRSLLQIGNDILDTERAECRVQSNKVRTFDNVKYRTPMTTCFSVLAKDCPESRDPEFAVLMKKVEKSSEEKKIKVISRDNVIEIEKRPGKEEVVISVNGENNSDEDFLKKLNIYKKGEKYVVVELPQIKIEFDGYMANIKMSESYKSQQCGICGHYDGERSNEFRRADNKETEDIEEFQRSYLYKEDECEMDEETLSEKKNYELLSRDDEEEEKLYGYRSFAKVNKYDENDQEIIEPIERTRVVEYSHRVCFSKTPVPECPLKSYAPEDRTIQMKVKFACVSRSSPEASRLTRHARRDVVSIEHIPDSFTETLFVPKECLAF